MTKAELLAAMKARGACAEATEWVQKSKLKTASALWNACDNPSWLFWFAARVGIDRPTIVSAACLCAREALVYVPKGEDRPRICIETTERWTRNEATLSDVRKARKDAATAADAAAYAAAYATAADAAATAAAYAAAAADAYADAYADADATAAAYATAATAAAYATAATAAARKKSLAKSADLLRTLIPWSAIGKCLKRKVAA